MKPIEIKNTVEKGLKSIQENEQWHKEYLAWKNKEENQPVALLKINNPFNLIDENDSFSFNFEKYEDRIDAENILISVFFCKKLLNLEQKKVRKVINARFLKEKGKEVSEYFEMLDTILKNKEICTSVVVLDKLAKQNFVLHTKKHDYDISTYLCRLLEILNKESVESIYLLFTKWRERQTVDNLKKVLISIGEYLYNYFNKLNVNPEMELFHLKETYTINEMIAAIVHWLTYIYSYTSYKIKEYKKEGFEISLHRTVDDIFETSNITNFEMMQYSIVFKNDKESIKKYADANHSVIVFTKTIDIYYIILSIIRILRYYSKEQLTELNMNIDTINNCFDKMERLIDSYLDLIYEYRFYYKDNKKYFDTEIMEEMEKDSLVIGRTIDESIKLIEACNECDIDKITQTKYEYIKNVYEHITEKQKDELDRITETVVERIKNIVQKTNLYDELYKNVSKEFSIYSNELLLYPQILVSLVSAEYLYKQYIEGKEENKSFDYSCISIMYFLALEDFVNKLVYKQYLKKVISRIDINCIKDNNWKKEKSKNYFSDVYSYINKKSFKDSCEIGVIGHLFKDVKKEKEFKRFMELEFPSIELENVSKLGQKLIDVAARRNNAAHGGNYLSKDDALIDKHTIYEECATQEYKGLIIELLNILFKR